MQFFSQDALIKNNYHYQRVKNRILIIRGEKKYIMWQLSLLINYHSLFQQIWLAGFL